MSYKLKAVCHTVKGEFKKSKNEDLASVDDYDNCRIAVLSDGMGGEAGGARASKIVVESSQKKVAEKLELWSNKSQLEDELVSILNEINQEVTENPDAGGATVELIAKIGDYIHIGHAGDSAIYVMYTDGSLEKVTYDNTNVGDMVAKGLVKEEEKYNVGFPITINQHIGKADCKFTYYKRNLREIKYIAVLSDGLNKRIKDSEMEEIMNKESSLEKIMEKIYEIADEPQERADEASEAKKKKMPEMIISYEEILDELKNDDATLILLEKME